MDKLTHSFVVNIKENLGHIQNKIGVPQGNPISAKLFIIYADRVMNNYQIKSNYNNIPR